MKPAAFSFHAPETLDQALSLMASLPNARAIAGGQSLMPMLNMRLLAPDHIIDLNGISSLQGIRQVGDYIAIGAMTRQRELEFSGLLKQSLPLLAEAILLVGHRQTRNRGTIGGSLCHLDPSAELPTVCMAMDATLIASQDGGQRTITIQDFAESLMTTTLGAEELLTEIRLMPWAPGHGYSFVEFGRRHGDFAIAAAAVLLDLTPAGQVERVALSLGGVGSMPFRLGEAEALMLGNRCDEALLDAAAAKLADYQQTLDDPAYPASYRLRIGQRLLRRALGIAASRAIEARVH